MSDAGESGDIKKSFVEDMNKIDIELTQVNLGCVKNELNEEALDFEEDSQATQYRITLGYENIFGECSHQLKIEEDYDNLIGFFDNDVIMENAMVKLEAIKEEDDGSRNNFHCRKCKGIYKGYCLMCSTLLHILNNNLAFVKSESQSNTVPTDILEIRTTSRGNGVYLLRTLPINIIFGPFEGILGIESTVGYSWKVMDNKLMNIKFGNWMKNIACATSASLKNLDSFQIDGNLYFQTNREITEGEELLIYYDNEELQQLDNSEECLYTPRKQEKLPKIFACTICCLGFSSNKCLMEHKGKCQVEQSRGMKEFVLIECHYCKMWMEKWEHEEHHVAYCLEKHHRTLSDYLKAVDRNDANVKEMGDDCGTRAGKRRYRRDISSIPKDRRNDLQFDRKDYQWFSGAKHETFVKESTLAQQSNNKRIQNEIQSNNKSRLQKHLNKHRGIKPFKCDICMAKFGQKGSLKMHIRNKHTDDGAAKDYQCSVCSYETNNKFDLKRHLNTHIGIKAFKCDICMMQFTQKSSLNTHIKNKHADNDGGKDYKCAECNYQTNGKTNFQDHLTKHTGIKRFTCDVCAMTFTQRRDLTMHIKNKHSDDGSVKDYKCFECPYQTNYKHHFQDHLTKHTGIKRFTCHICAMKFTLKHHLKGHIKNKHSDDGGSAKDYKCSECPYQTNYKYHYQGHLNMHRGIKRFTCDICGMKFTLKDYLRRHIKNKHADDGDGGKAYKCAECNYQTNLKTNLQRHLNKHKGIKLFKCEICLKEYTENSNLKMHIKNKHTTNVESKDYKCSECSYHTNYKHHYQGHLNMHRGIKRFTCDICMMTFTAKGHLNIHLQKHSGIKPFTCDICMKEFIQKCNLKTHIKNKHADGGSVKDYQCLECSYETNDKSNFQRHLNTHTGKRPIKCDICMMQFSWKDSLTKHIKNMHADDGGGKD